MKQELSEKDYEYVMVWVHNDEATQLPSPPSTILKKKGFALRVIAKILTFSLKKSLGL